jgi:hypothetical protein
MKQNKVKVMPIELHGAELLEQSQFPLWSVIFHYNNHTENWYCISREHYVDYFNGIAKENHGHGKTLVDAYRNYCIKSYGKK